MPGDAFVIGGEGRWPGLALAITGPRVDLPVHWPALPPGSRGAAVALLFIPGEAAGKSCRLVLTRRSTKVASHKGQIAFPGGRREHADASPIMTACRELHEEVGIPSDRLSVLTALPPVASLDGSLVYPLVMAAEAGQDDFHLDSSEVDELILAPWNDFTPERQGSFVYTLFGIKRHSFLFHSCGHPVWGLTAKVLARAGLAALSEASAAGLSASRSLP